MYAAPPPIFRQTESRMTDAPAPAAEDVPARPLRALMWMLGAIASFLLMSVAGRAILQEFDTFELMLYRSAIGFVVVATVIALSPRGFAQVRTRHPGLHVTRNLFHFTGQNLWFFALGSIPLAQLVGARIHRSDLGRAARAVAARRDG